MYYLPRNIYRFTYSNINKNDKLVYDYIVIHMHYDRYALHTYHFSVFMYNHIRRWNRPKFFRHDKHLLRVYPFLNVLLVIAMRTLSPTRNDCVGYLGTGMLCMSLRSSSSSSVVTYDGDICIVRCLPFLY